jgi:hypothetical protein
LSRSCRNSSTLIFFLSSNTPSEPSSSITSGPVSTLVQIKTRIGSLVRLGNSPQGRRRLVKQIYQIRQAGKHNPWDVFEPDLRTSGVPQSPASPSSRLLRNGFHSVQGKTTNIWTSLRPARLCDSRYRLSQT